MDASASFFCHKADSLRIELNIGGEQGMKCTSIMTICSYMTEDIRVPLMKAEKAVSEASEIRLYNGRGAAVCDRNGCRFLCRDGSLSAKFNSGSIMVTTEQLKNILSRLSRYSVYSHEKELTEGCFVLENGVRVGISGTFSEGGKLKDISSMNFRIARQVIGCGEELFSSTCGRSLIICGAVNSGKTTILRDLCRLYGNAVKCTLIDSRNEIAAVIKGKPANDVGMLTDIITGKSRHDGIISAVRTLSPGYIFCDEIADSSDAEAIREGIGCGVKFIATIHADSVEELLRRSVVRTLLNIGAFEKAAFLHSGGRGVREIRSMKNVNKICGSEPYSDMRISMGNVTVGQLQGQADDMR